MADPPRDPDTSDDTGTPRWMYASGIVVIVLVVLFVFVFLTGGGHTPPPGAH